MSVIDEALTSILPEPVLGPLQEALADQQIELHLVRTLTAGYTEAVVAVVKMRHSQNGDRLAILKVDQSARILEPEAHEKAIEASPDRFADRYLVTQAHDPVFLPEGWFVMFQEIAGGGITELIPLSQHSGKATLRSFMLKVSDTVLSSWNPSRYMEYMEVGSFLKLHFKEKLASNSAFSEWARSSFGPEVLTAPRIIAGASGTFINPFCLSEWKQLYSKQIHVLTGNSHGDLHMENVLVTRNQALQDLSFKLIDLTTFTASGPLSRDVVNLFVSELERVVTPLAPLQREALLQGLRGKLEGMPASLVALVDLWSDLQNLGSAYADGSGASDDWRLQFLLSLVGAAIQSASRPRRENADRKWFLVLAAAALTDACVLAGIDVQPAQGINLDAPPNVHLEASSPANVAHEILRACGQFSGGCLTVLVAADDIQDQLTGLDVPVSAWNLIVEFDPRTDVDGWYSKASRHDPAIRLFAPGQMATAVSRAPVWLAATDLASPSGYVAPKSIREWRSHTLPKVKDTLRSFVVLEAGTIVVIHFGRATIQSRAVVEELMDASGERAALVTVNDDQNSLFEEYEPRRFKASPVAVLKALPPRPPSTGRGRGRVMLPAGPGHDRVPIEERDLVWYSDVGEVLHSDVELIEVLGKPESDFYRGHTISWAEVADYKDIPRQAMADLVQEVRHKLSERGTLRMAITHQPGSGGTTVARRLAWEVHEDHPVLCVTKDSPVPSIVDRVRKLAEVTSSQCLVVLDHASTRLSDDIYAALKSQSVPALIITVARRSSKSGALVPVVGRLSTDEQRNFARIFVTQTQDPDARARIHKIGNPGGDAPLPFFYALNAYQLDFAGLAPYVGGFIQKMPDSIREVVLDIAIAHRYGRGELPSQQVASFLGASKDAVAFVRRELNDLNDNLLVEEPLGSWRMSHVLVAEEYIKQTLTPPGIPSNSRAETWRGGLSTAAQNLIHRLAEAYPERLPLQVENLLEGTFIDREQPGDSAAVKRRFSELLEDIDSYSGRLEVLSTLVEVFPDNEHFLAHYARLRSYQGDDYQSARMLIDEALTIAPDDPVLMNIKGVIIRNEVNRLLSGSPQPRWVDDLDFRSHLSELALEAVDWFKRAESRDQESESNPVLILELVTKVLKRLKPRNSTYSELLLKAANVVLAELFDEAEEAVVRLERMLGDERQSHRVQEAVVNLHELRDDRAMLLQGWRNILDQSPHGSPRARLRLARLYWDGSDRGANMRPVRQAVELLNDNLRDDAYDVRSIQLWLQVSRFTATSLSRAALAVERWKTVEITADSLFYDWAISTLLLLEGNHAELASYEQKLDRLRHRTASLRQRRTMFEWIGEGTGLSQLIDTRDPRLANWDRANEQTAPKILKRFEARVKRISGPTSGYLILESGIEVFFTPAPSGLLAGRDENARVTAIVGLSYDGLRAWNLVRHQG
ncbi:P-loop NTPase [Arthrobacter sp. MAHUQ-56]